MLFLYDALQYCLRIEAKSLHDKISSKLIGSIEKRTWETAMTDKDNGNFSVVYSLLKIRSKAYIYICKYLLNYLKYVISMYWLGYRDFSPVLF